MSSKEKEPKSPVSSSASSAASDASPKSEEKSKGLSNVIRGMVSKKKKRFQQDGFDLDLSYITPRVIAMGLPSESLAAAYRNPLEEVQKFFKKYHDGHYRLYNLCSESEYDISKFDNSVARFPFDDHNAPEFGLILKFCQDVDKFLKDDEKNVVAVHCKAGKGRTGTMIACYLLYSGTSKNAAEALEYFGEQRTTDKKGVTIPSQKRYVHYFDHFLTNYHRKDVPFTSDVKLHLNKIVFHTIPNFDVQGGCDPYFFVYNAAGEKIYNYKKESKEKVKHVQGDGDLTLECDVDLQGDVKFCFFDEDTMSKDDKIFHFWFNTAFVEKSHLSLAKKELDKAVKDKKNKHFNPKFSIELFFK